MELLLKLSLPRDNSLNTLVVVNKRRRGVRVVVPGRVWVSSGAHAKVGDARRPPRPTWTVKRVHGWAISVPQAEWNFPLAIQSLGGLLVVDQSHSRSGRTRGGRELGRSLCLSTEVTREVTRLIIQPLSRVASLQCGDVTFRIGQHVVQLLQRRPVYKYAGRQLNQVLPWDSPDQRHSELYHLPHRETLMGAE